MSPSTKAQLLIFKVTISVRALSAQSIFSTFEMKRNLCSFGFQLGVFEDSCAITQSTTRSGYKET
uniref:Uncharacterized protein n=1 Tax=Romanomermis culicivorax TaxID=13658 RepID=A0A915JCL6_ROMCU